MISITATSPLVLIRLYLSGLLEIFLSFDDLEADWDKSNFFSDDDTGIESTLVLYERLNLDIPVIPLSGAKARHARRSKASYGQSDDSADEKDDSLPQSDADRYLSTLVPRMSLDPVLKDIFYVRHVAGVHLVKLRWFQKLQEFCSNESAGEPAASLPDLPSSSVELLLDTMPLRGRHPISATEF